MEKNELRKQMKLARLALCDDQRNEKSIAAGTRLLPLLEGCKTVAFYRPIQGEINPESASMAFVANGGIAVYPRVEGKTMVMACGETQKGAFGIIEPTGKAYDGQVDAVVVPLLATDKQGNRLGWGKGYYDKYLQGKTCLKIGFCYDFQVIERVNAEVWDQPLDVIVTEKRTMIIKGKE